MKEGTDKAIRKGRGVSRAVCVIAGGSGAVLLFFLFARLGNTHEPARFGASILGWLVSQWRNPGSESAHGFLIPLVSAYFIWRKRDTLRELIARGEVDWRAMAVIVTALLMYWAGVRAQQPRLGVLALIAHLWAVPWLLFGIGVGRQLMLPCTYLLFAVPMGFLTSATLPLRIMASSIAVTLLQGLGVGVYRRGTAILSTEPGRFALDVAEACSGLRSLIALCALVAAYAYISHRSNWRRWALFLCAIPIAILGNTARVMFLVVFASRFGTDRALTVAHDYSGYIVFTVAVLLMVTVSRQIERIGSHGQEM